MTKDGQDDQGRPGPRTRISAWSRTGSNAWSRTGIPGSTTLGTPTRALVLLAMTYTMLGAGQMCRMGHI